MLSYLHLSSHSFSVYSAFFHCSANERRQSGTSLTWEIWLAFKSKTNDVFNASSALKPVRECRAGKGVEMQKTHSTFRKHGPILKMDEWFPGPLDGEALVDSSAMDATTACVIPPVTTFIYEIRCNMVTGFTSCHVFKHTQK